MEQLTQEEARQKITDILNEVCPGLDAYTIWYLEDKQTVEDLGARAWLIRLWDKNQIGYKPAEERASSKGVDSWAAEVKKLLKSRLGAGKIIQSRRKLSRNTIYLTFVLDKNWEPPKVERKKDKKVS